MVRADSGTTHYEYLCTKFSGEDIGSRDYPGEWISCIDLYSTPGRRVVFTSKRPKAFLHEFPDTAIGEETQKLANFILEKFDELDDLSEISPEAWDRVIG